MRNWLIPTASWRFWDWRSQHCRGEPREDGCVYSSSRPYVTYSLSLALATPVVTGVAGSMAGSIANGAPKLCLAAKATQRNPTAWLICPRTRCSGRKAECVDLSSALPGEREGGEKRKRSEKTNVEGGGKETQVGAEQYTNQVQYIHGEEGR